MKITNLWIALGLMVACTDDGTRDPRLSGTSTGTLAGSGVVPGGGGDRAESTGPFGASDEADADADEGETESTTERPELRCDPQADFVALTEHTEIEGDVGHPWLTADELELWITVDFDIHRATRDSRKDPFSPSQPVQALNTTNQDYAASLTEDGLRVYFTRSGYSTFLATRAAVDAPFNELYPLSVSRQGMSVSTVRRLGDHRYYYAWADELPLELYFDNLDVDTERVLIGGGTPDGLSGYALTGDEGVLYYGVLDEVSGVRTTYRAVRSDIEQPFARGTQVQGLGTTAEGLSVTWVSDDECVLYGNLPGLDPPVEVRRGA